jgi:hypothetical protein
MNKRYLILAIVMLGVVVGGCNKPFLRAKPSKDVTFESRTYKATANNCYYAIRFALKRSGYTMSSENLADGLLKSSWVPVTSDSHYLPLFDSRDYGVTGAYHQLEIQVVPHGSHRTEVRVGSRVKAVVTGLQSSGVEERKVLAEVGDYLRKNEPEITNDGIGENG